MSEANKLAILEKQLQPYKSILGQASDVILEQDVSKYPIFAVHQQELELGIALIEAGKSLPWSVNASTLEEFVTKGLIFDEKVQEFIKTYKDPHTQLCLFVLSELGAQFIFIPRKDQD